MNARRSMFGLAALALLAVFATLSCSLEDPGVAAPAPSAPSTVDISWLTDTRWDDGAAEVLVYRGRIKRYDAWRDAEVRDYLIREYLHPAELTKRDAISDDLLRVLKINRQVTFSTGTYDYRRMSSLFLERNTGALVRAVGSSQDGCGLTFQRWARGTHSWDSYWAGEGAGRSDRPRTTIERFAEETPFVVRLLPDGAAIREWPGLTRSRVGPWTEADYRVERDGKSTVLRDGDGREHARFEYDEEGFLLRWKIEGAEEFERVTRRRLYYWEHTAPGDQRLLRAD